MISELPRTRETLLLRLLGRPADRLAATLDLQKLNSHAVEHRVAYEWLIRLHSELKKEDPAILVQEEREFVMGEWLQERDRKLVESAVAKTQREARVELLRLQLKMRLGRELAKSELAVLRKRVSQEKSAERLFAIASQSTAADLTAWLSSAGK